MIILEQLDHLGRVKGHHKLDGPQLRIGRSYDNDLVLSDPFVCPHHLQLEVADDDSLLIRDLNTLNGLYPYQGKQRVAELRLDANEAFRIGHTTLRYRRPDFEVAATRQDRLGMEFGNQLLNSRLAQWGGFLLLGLLLTLFSYINSYHELKPLQMVRAQLLPYAMALLVWAGFWALLSRILTHNFYFSAHSIIATLMLLVSLVYEDYLEPVLMYAFNTIAAVELFSYLVTFIIMASALYAHLRFCSARSTRYLSSVAAGLSVVLVALSAVGQYRSQDRFSNHPQYHDIIMPAAYQLVPNLKLDEFIERSLQLKQTLEQRVELQQSEEEE